MNYKKNRSKTGGIFFKSDMKTVFGALGFHLKRKIPFYGFSAFLNDFENLHVIHSLQVFPHKMRQKGDKKTKSWILIFLYPSTPFLPFLIRAARLKEIQWEFIPSQLLFAFVLLHLDKVLRIKRFWRLCFFVFLKKQKRRRRTNTAKTWK